jgi:hypothetical protein
MGKGVAAGRPLDDGGMVCDLEIRHSLGRDGHGMRGCAAVEKDVSFSPDLLRAGRNTLRLTIPGGGLMNGIIYDYLRLEAGAPLFRIKERSVPGKPGA